MVVNSCHESLRKYHEIQATQMPLYKMDDNLFFAILTWNKHKKIQNDNIKTQQKTKQSNKRTNKQRN